ncbi:unnamed protein product [Aureobasidium mustum]|uniref:DUF7896 domain-containing protein n=1 Tax=Aureobasidium mustum TaxID=2773714 RepID=A0A9N8JYP4_9PEZI|nr:unnamed protein product [Aureobasidium mustum]
MSQARSNLGYYNTFNGGGMVYNESMSNNIPQNGQAVYTQPWSQMPIGVTIPLTGSQWSGQYYRRHEGCGLLSNIGGAFMPPQLPTCATSNPDEAIPQSDFILGDLELNDTISSPPDSDAVSHTAMHRSPLPDAETSLAQPCHTQPHDQSVAGRPRKARQAKETDTRQSKRPARTKSTRTRLFCEACRDSKDYSRGFRGEHELARHYAQKHTRHKKVWKCFDLSPERLMRNCERCKTGHQYGTSYGGAEHFRRKHTAIFGKDMMELLRGKNQRWALSSNRLIEEGWLRQVFVPGDGEPVLHQEEQAATASHPAMPFTGDTQEFTPNSGMQRAHLQQPYDQQHMPMHDANLAWAQHQYTLQPYPQLHHGRQQQHHHQQHQQQWHAGMH